MATRTPSIHVFLGRPLFLLSPGIHYIINFGSLSSCILLTWPYYWSLFLSVMSTMSGFIQPFCRTNSPLTHPNYVHARESWTEDGEEKIAVLLRRIEPPTVQ